MLLIFLVETQNANNDSDYVYLKEFMNHYYKIGSNKLVSIYLNGKGNYDKKEKQIDATIKKYRAARNNQEAPVQVIMCVDIDNITSAVSAFANKLQNDKIMKYCSNKGYELVWFYETVEEVFLGHRVSNAEKVIAATKFAKDGTIKNIDINKFKVNAFRENVKCTSNLKNVLDKYLFKNN